MMAQGVVESVVDFMADIGVGSSALRAIGKF